MVRRFTNLASALLVLACLVAAPQTLAAEAKCQLQKLAELKVLNDGGAPEVAVGINGHEAAMVVDTGSARTVLLTPAAKALGLRLTDGPQGMQMFGAGGETTVYETTVSRFDFGGASVRDMTFLVAGEHGIGKAAGLLGWDLLSHWDVEFDLGHHVVRLLRPVGCKGDDVVYWAANYNRAPIEPMTGDHMDIDVPISLNRADVVATLDSGASETIVTPLAAGRARATVSPLHGPGIRGLGGAESGLSVAHFDTIGIGGEEIRDTSLLVSDLFARDTVSATGSIIARRLVSEPEVLLGADFLRAHRVLIATDQNKLYFTYEGGPVFSTPSSTPPAASPPTH